MRTVALQIQAGAEWWFLSRRTCHEHEVVHATVEMKRLMTDWENSRYFPGGTSMRVVTI